MRNAIATLLIGLVLIIFSCTMHIQELNKAHQNQILELGSKMDLIVENYDCEVENLENNLNSL